MAIELVSFDTLKPLLDLNDTEKDYPDLTLIQESVVTSLEDHTHRTFSEDNYEEELFTGGMPTKMIPLLAIPISSITEVTIDGEVTDDYEIRNYGIEMGRTITNQTVKVTYAGGIIDVPAGLERAARLQTMYEYQHKTSIGLEIVSTPGGTITKPEVGMLKEVKKLLQKHMHPYPTF